jgi:hypothetical protein
MIRGRRLALLNRPATGRKRQPRKQDRAGNDQLDAAAADAGGGMTEKDLLHTLRHAYLGRNL